MFEINSLIFKSRVFKNMLWILDKSANLLIFDYNELEASDGWCTVAPLVRKSLWMPFESALEFQVNFDFEILTGAEEEWWV